MTSTKRADLRSVGVSDDHETGGRWLTMEWHGLFWSNRKVVTRWYGDNMRQGGRVDLPC